MLPAAVAGPIQGTPTSPTQVRAKSIGTETSNLRSSPSLSLDLSPQRMSDYCDIWFELYHSWCPILHQPTILESCQAYGNDTLVSPPKNNSSFLVLKAIAAVTIPATPLRPHATQSQQQRYVTKLEDEILLTAFRNLSLQSLQALLILTVSVFGSGRVSEFYNIIALCKKMSTQLGLRDLVHHEGINFGMASTIPPRMLFPPSTAVEREEKIRAFWTAEALDSISTLGAAWNLSVSRPEPTISVPCDEEIWRYPEAVLATYLFGSSDAPSSLSLFVSLATNELWHVHHFLQESYSPKATVDFHKRSQDCDIVFQRLMSWQAEFEGIMAVNTPPYVDLFSAAEGTRQHPNTILIFCTIHSAVVSLYHRFIFSENAIYTGATSWECAVHRCVASCDLIADIARDTNEGILETINPHVIFCLFNAARFYIIYARASQSRASDKLNPITYALAVAGRRWPLAKQLKVVIDDAVANYQLDITGAHSLPAEFYDLQYLSWDIHEALRQWELRISEDRSPIETIFH